MHITSKGQVTIPQHVRFRLGLLPNTEVEFELADDHARIRKIQPIKHLSARGQSALTALSGAADTRMSTDEIMALTRGVLTRGTSPRGALTRRVPTRGSKGVRRKSK